MSSSNGSTVNHSPNHSEGHCWGGFRGAGNWSGINIAAMVMGFILFWPIGLVILYWIFRGRDVQDLPGAVRRKVSGIFGDGHRTRGHAHGSDNEVFNDYQQTQFDRISEIKEEIRERSRRFREYREDAKRRADEEEFNQFMSNAPVSNGG